MTLSHIVFDTASVIVALIAAIYLVSRFVVVHGQQAAVVERFGVPQLHPMPPGLHFLVPFNAIAKTVDLKQQQIERLSQVKTADDAFIEISWVVRFSVRPADESVLAFVYKVGKPIDQLIFRVENELRQIVAGMSLNALYQQKDGIAQQIIADQLTSALETGLQIDGVVIEQPSPPKEVQAAMNNKIAALARQDAAAAEAEAERRRRVGLARAEAESKELQGQGIAKQRQAVAQGFKDSFDLMQSGMPEATAADVLALMQQTIQADMVATAAASGKATIIFVPTGIGAMPALSNMLPAINASGAQA